MSHSTARPRRDLRAERSEETRRLLLEATIEALVEVGYARASTTEIAERAGVSRGAQLHHYPAKVQLVVAAMELFGEQRIQELEQLLGGLSPDERTVEAAIDLFWSMYKGPSFPAWLELQVAARTNAELAQNLTLVTRRFVERIEAHLQQLSFGESGMGLIRDPIFLFAVLDGLALQRASYADEQRCVAVLENLKQLTRAGGD